MDIQDLCCFLLAELIPSFNILSLAAFSWDFIICLNEIWKNSFEKKNVMSEQKYIWANGDLINKF